MRNVEDLILQTLRVVLSEGTDIPSGRIYLKKPAKEFVSKDSGANLSADSVSEFPSIGINFMKDAKFAPNNYGNTILVHNPDKTTTEYSPMAEITLYLGISLFTASRKDQREYGARLYQTLLSNRLITFRQDVIPSEYFRFDLLFQKEAPGNMPYHQIYIGTANSRILKEHTAHTIHSVEMNLGMEEGVRADTIEVVPYLTATSGGVVYHN